MFELIFVFIFILKFSLFLLNMFVLKFILKFFSEHVFPSLKHVCEQYVYKKIKTKIKCLGRKWAGQTNKKVSICTTCL